MRTVYSGSAIRAAEKPLLDAGAGDALMRQAAWGLAVHTATLLRDHDRKISGARVVGLIGSGNNGGDGLWALSFLASRGVHVTAIALTGSADGSDTHADGRDAFLRAGGRFLATEAEPDTEYLITCDAVIDAVFGTGFRGDYSLPEQLAARGITLRDPAGARPLVVACDIVSGITADTGQIGENTSSVLEADLTVTFGGAKIGQFRGPGRLTSGQVEVVDIGLGPHLADQPHVLIPDLSDISATFPGPRPTDHKYSRGVLALAAGSTHYPGAGLLVARGALATGGAGMVNPVYPETLGAHLGQMMLRDRPELVISPDPVAQTSAWVIGPGLGDTLESRDRLRAGLTHAIDHDLPLVLDASALTLVTHDDLLALGLGSGENRTAPTVLTPHTGELGSLAARMRAELAEDTPAPGTDDLDTARWLSDTYGVYVIAKGPDTLITAPGCGADASPSRPDYVLHPAVSADLATAGTGDTLAGILGAALARPRTSWSVADVLRALAASVHLHGLAGAHAAAHVGPVTASILADAVAAVLHQAHQSHQGHHG